MVREFEHRNAIEVDEQHLMEGIDMALYFIASLCIIITSYQARQGMLYVETEENS